MTISATGRKKRCGFTLIEFLFVIVLIGILITVSLPYLKKGMDNARLNSFVSELQSLVVFLRERAIVEGEPIQLNIDLENARLFARFKEAQENLRILVLPEGLALESEKKQVFFYPDGTIDGTTLTVFCADGPKITLSTKGVFGGFKILPAE